MRSEEVVIGKCLRPFFVNGRHENTEIHMRTKFHLHALYGVQVQEVKKWLEEKVPEAIFVDGCHGNT